MILQKGKKYLQVALNSTLEQAEAIIGQLPSDERVLIEAGTPLITAYGEEAMRFIRRLVPPSAYIVADLKCADLALREVAIANQAGAQAATCLGASPIETINNFIDACFKNHIDSMLDMMNVQDSIAVLRKLKKLPDVVILHRGVDESEFSREKQIPYYQIKQIKGYSNKILTAVAGGDTLSEVQRAVFNGADIVIVWKHFYQSGEDTAKLADEFLKTVR